MRYLWSQQRMRIPQKFGSLRYQSRTSTMKDTQTMSGFEHHTASKGSIQQESQTSSNEQPLPLPEPPKADEGSTLDMSSGSASVKMDAMGPLVVNQDGSLSRIENWHQMTEMEKKSTLRIIGKRNQARREALLAMEAEKEGKE